jgi:hypothetical protein
MRLARFGRLADSPSSAFCGLGASIFDFNDDGQTNSNVSTVSEAVWGFALTITKGLKVAVLVIK